MVDRRMSSHAKTRWRYCALGALYSGDDPDFFLLALESLSEQTFSIPIYLVVDGPISEELRRILLAANLGNLTILWQSENKGLAAALDFGITTIGDQYDYVVRFDADDINIRSRFAKTIDYIEEYSPDLVSAHVREIDQYGQEIAVRFVPTNPAAIARAIPYRNPINHPASAMKISAVQEAGGYKDMPFFEDWYLWSRMHKLGFRVSNIDDILVDFRATEETVKRRFGARYMRREFSFFLRRHREGLVPKYRNWAAYCVRTVTKLFGFKVYKFIFFLVRR